VRECNDGLDNDSHSDIDAADPDCHTDGVAANPWSYDPLDDEEDALLTNECSDGVDNTDLEDTLADMDDPGCSDPSDTDERTPPPVCDMESYPPLYPCDSATILITNDTPGFYNDDLGSFIDSPPMT
jgi:hypothetical protein